MQEARYYRDQAEHMRGLSRRVTGEAYETLKRIAQDFDDIAVDLESGAIEIRHSDLMPQRRR